MVSGGGPSSADKSSSRFGAAGLNRCGARSHVLATLRPSSHDTLSTGEAGQAVGRTATGSGEMKRACPSSVNFKPWRSSRGFTRECKDKEFAPGMHPERSVDRGGVVMDGV